MASSRWEDSLDDDEKIMNMLPDELLIIGLKHLFRVDDYEIITQHAKSSLNFYVGNPICKTTISYSIKVLINAMHMPVSGDYMFSPIPICSEQVQGEPTSHEAIKKDPTLVLDSNSNMRLRQLMNDEYYSTWYNHIWEMLDSSHPAVINKAINYLGFLYLNLMRLVKTQSGSLQYHITKNLSINFKKFWNISDFSKITPPPHPEFYDEFRMQFKKTQKNCCDVLGYLIEANKMAKEILDEACLKELKFTGMGIIHWFYKAASHLKVEKRVFLIFLITRSFDRYLLRPYLFNRTIKKIDEYENLEDCASRPYCRLFKDSAHCDLAVKNDPLFVAIMVHIIHSEGDLSIFNIPQLKSITDAHKSEASRIARIIVLSIGKN